MIMTIACQWLLISLIVVSSTAINTYLYENPSVVWEERRAWYHQNHPNELHTANTNIGDKNLPRQPRNVSVKNVLISDAAENLFRKGSTDDYEKYMRESRIGLQQQRVVEQIVRKEGQSEAIWRKTELEMAKINAETQKYCSSQIGGRRKRSICGGNISDNYLDLKPGSVHVDENQVIQFDVIDKRNADFEHRVEISMDKRQFVEQNFLEDMLARGESKRGTWSDRQMIDKVVGIYGIVKVVSEAEDEFQMGDAFRGSMFLSEGVFMTGEVAGINQILSKVSQKVAASGVAKISSKFGVEESVLKVRGRFAKSAVSRVMRRLPFVDLVFDVYLIENDIKDLITTNRSDPSEIPLLPLKKIHLVFDVAILVTDALFLEPISIILELIEAVIDYAYENLWRDLQGHKWNSAKGFFKGLGIVFKDLGKGIGDILSGGLLHQKSNFEQEVEFNNKLLAMLSDSKNYYTFDRVAENVTAINFASGNMSVFGGSITFKLLDDNQAILTIEGIPKQGGGTQTLQKTFTINSTVSQIILGFGQSRSFTYEKKKSKLWGFIPIKTYNLICGEQYDPSSLHGTYYGNTHNNTFIAVQQVNASKSNAKQQNADSCLSKYGKMDAKFNLANYSYTLYGHGGSDRFFLGPQSSYVSGGEDSDTYVIDSDGGNVAINNFAQDKIDDVLFINVSFSKITCKLLQDNLIILYGDSGKVMLEFFYRTSRSLLYQHVLLRSGDGVIFSANKTTGRNPVTCIATMIDKSDASQGEVIDIRIQEYKYVSTVIGTRFNDTITGNEQDNTLDNGGGGSDYMQGGEGKDNYIIKGHSYNVTINNFAVDNKTDTLKIEVEFNDIEILQNGHHLVFTVNQCSSNDTCTLTSTSLCNVTENCTDKYVKILNWFSDDRYNHISFLSSDFTEFAVTLDNGILMKVPKLLDFSQSQNGVVIDLENKMATGINLPQYAFSNIESVVDSSFDDELTGNRLSNLLTCSGGSDKMQGNAETDIYLMKKHCTFCIINNYSEDQKNDIVFLDFHVDDVTLAISPDGKSLSMDTSNSKVTLFNWFHNDTYQHLNLQMKNAAAAMLPKTSAQMREWDSKPRITEMNSDPVCGEDGQYVLDMRQDSRYSMLQRVRLQSDSCSYHIVGNNQDNYIELGKAGPHGEQYVEGGNGSDVYVVKGNDGQIRVNNTATDGVTDHLKLQVMSCDLSVERGRGLDGDSLLVLTSENMNQDVRVVLVDYCRGETQHLQIHTDDGVVADIHADCQSTQLNISEIDHSFSEQNQTLNLSSEANTQSTKSVYGARTSENDIIGNDVMNIIIGGQLADTLNGLGGVDYINGQGGDDNIHGGCGQDVILAGTGNDVIHGGEDDDIIHPGDGADVVNGGPGYDTLIFKGTKVTDQDFIDRQTDGQCDVVAMTGVYVDLHLGYGLHADAQDDFYISMENVMATDFDDIIIGNGVNNVLSGYRGDDTIISGNGDDEFSGGEGIDTYILSQSNGWKTIDNFALDNAIDIVVINSSQFAEMCYFRDQNSLFVSFIKPDLTHDNTIPPLSVDIGITIENWFINASFRHLDFSLQDKDISDSSTFFHNALDMGEFHDRLTNYRNISVISGIMQFYVEWGEDIWTMAQSCSCDLYLVYNDTSGHHTVPLVRQTTHYHFRTTYMNTVHLSLLMGKCGRLVSASQPQHFSNIRPYVILFVCLGVGMFVIISGMVIFLKRRRNHAAMINKENSPLLANANNHKNQSYSTTYA